MCMKCSSNQEYAVIAGQGPLCKKCTEEWHNLYYSQSKIDRINSVKIWGVNGVWTKFMRDIKEKVVFI